MKEKDLAKSRATTRDMGPASQASGNLRGASLCSEAISSPSNRIYSNQLAMAVTDKGLCLDSRHSHRVDIT